MSDLTHAALIPIDVQRGFDYAPWGRRNNPAMEANGRRLLAAWRETARPLIHVRHDSILPGGSAAPAVMKLVQSELQTAYDAGSVRTDIPLEAYVEVIGRVFEAVMRDWAEGRTDDVIERIGQLVSVTFNGINTRRKPQARPKG